MKKTPIVLAAAAVLAAALVYALWQPGANRSSGGSADLARFDALRKGDMAKLVFEQAPRPFGPVTLATLDGGEVTLPEATSGRWAVINFWATWCAPCRKEMPSLASLAAQLEPEGLRVVAIATGHNPAAQVRAFLAEVGAEDLMVLLDPDMTAARGAAALGLPTTVVLDPVGRIVARLVGEADWAAPEALALIRALAATEG